MMTLAAAREPDVVLRGFVDWLRDQDPTYAPEWGNVVQPTAGFSSETFLVDVRRTGGASPREERLVLKLPPSGPAIFRVYDFELQALVQTAVAANGVPAPVPARTETNIRWVGAPFLVMPAVAGHIIEQVPTRDAWLIESTPELNARVHGHYIDLIADIHRIDWRSSELATVVPARDNAAELEYWHDYLEWMADGAVLVPALVEALAWCDANRPSSEPPPSLLWGDVRLGNVIYGEDRSPAAVLDWEMATIGAAEHDLAWTLTLQGTQDSLFRRTVPGFLDHDASVERYEARLGRRVQDLEWYEIFAMVRSTAIMVRIAHLHELAGLPVLFPLADNPILGLLERRIAAAESTRSD